MTDRLPHMGGDPIGRIFHQFVLGQVGHQAVQGSPAGQKEQHPANDFQNPVNTLGPNSHEIEPMEVLFALRAYTHGISG